MLNIKGNNYQKLIANYVFILQLLYYYSIRYIEKYLSTEAYRIVIGGFYLRLDHCIYKSSKILCGKYVTKRQTFQY